MTDVTVPYWFLSFLLLMFGISSYIAGVVLARVIRLYLLPFIRGFLGKT